MADMKPQVYKDERPAEYFDQFHASARKGAGWTYTLARIVVTNPARTIEPTKADIALLSASTGQKTYKQLT